MDDEGLDEDEAIELKDDRLWNRSENNPACQ